MRAVLEAGLQWLGDGRRLWRLWAVVLVAGGAAIWGLIDVPDASMQDSSAAGDPGAALPDVAALALPPVLSSSALTSGAVLLQAFPWGPEAKKPKVANGQQQAVLRWQVVGSFLGQDGKRRLMLRFEGDKEPPQYLGVGGDLPDGRRLRDLGRFEAQVFDPNTQKLTWLSFEQLGVAP